MTEYPAGMRVISAEKAGALLLGHLLGALGKTDQLAIDCALLRSCLWTLSGGERPVHSLRLLNLAVECEPVCLSVEKEDDSQVRLRLRNSLNELEAGGDVVGLANGRWLPAPTREVKLGTPDGTRLLVGGLPTSALPTELSAKLRHHGAFRRMAGGLVAKELGLPEESRDSWIGAGPPDIKAWTESVFQGEYEAFTEGNDSGRFSIYTPDGARPGTPQLRRWVDRPEKLSGRFLGRRDLPFGMRQHRAVELVQGRIARLQRLRLGTGDLRRLMYGLDALAKNPVTVEYETSSDEISVVLRSEIPRPEQRLFAALGQLSFPDEKYYPRIWRFPRQYGAEIHSRDEHIRPLRVFDDGARTFIQMPVEIQHREAPVLFVIGNDGKGEMTNYRVKEQTYIVDRLFDRANLVLGTGRKTQKVEITRGQPKG